MPSKKSAPRRGRWSRKPRAWMFSASRRLSARASPWSLRWIVTHMIEEYARHNGHADLLRESIDGRTGYY